jgi:non-ribosomal peptide synthetase component E (peptide arylation enzyme)
MSFAGDPAGWFEQPPGCANSLFLRTPQGRDLSYAELREKSGRIASALSQRGALPGDRIAVQVDKSPEAVLLYAACLRLGAVFVPINVANTPNEVEYFLRDSQIRSRHVWPDTKYRSEFSSLMSCREIRWARFRKIPCAKHSRRFIPLTQDLVSRSAAV